MEVRFTRAGDATVKVTVERDDGAVLETTSPGGRDRLPHDLIHYVVEHELGLDDGLWGRIAGGATFGNFRVLKKGTSRRPKPKGRASKRKGVLEAEVLVGIFHDIWTGTAEREWGSIHAFLDSVWSPRTRSRADELDEKTIRRVCNALDRAEAAWTRVPRGGEVRFSWPPRVELRSPP